VEPDDHGQAVVRVVLPTCTATPIQDLQAFAASFVTPPADLPSTATSSVPAARAHSPPAGRGTSPRAPPRSSRP
jgi:hypothetical protein